MEMANDLASNRRQAIATALAAEIERQAQTGASRIDVEALAEAVDAALDPAPPPPRGRGQTS